jgi:hypothetical protein
MLADELIDVCQSRQPAGFAPAPLMRTHLPLIERS